MRANIKTLLLAVVGCAALLDSTGFHTIHAEAPGSGHPEQRGIDTTYSPDAADMNLNIDAPRMEGELFPETRKRLLTAADIKGWPDAKLQYAINEMYARRNVDFGNKNIKKTFLAFEWYTPLASATFDAAELRFSAIETSNVKFLGDARQKLQGVGSKSAAPAPSFNQDAPPSVTPSGAKQQRAKGSLSPLVKGIAIGMDFANAKPWFEEKLKDTSLGYEVLPEGTNRVFLIANAGSLKYMQQGQGRTKISASGREEQLRIMPNGLAERPSFIMADSDGRVIAITLQPNVVNYLFRSIDITPDNFIKTFAEAYELSELKTDRNASFQTWTTSQGVKITISADKTVSLKKVVAPTDVRGAFD